MSGPGSSFVQRSPPTVRPPGGSSILEAIVKSASDAIISVALDGQITSWNPAAERLYGYGEAEAVGRHVSMIVPQERRQELESILARLQLGTRLEPYETVRIAKDGRRLWISVSISAVFDKSGRIIGGSAIQRDVSVIKQARAVDAVTKILDAAPNVRQAMPRFIETLAGELGCDIGEFWELDRKQGRMRRGCSYLGCSDEAVRAFDVLSNELTFAFGEGAPGSIAQGAMASGFIDIRDPLAFARSRQAAEAGIRSVLAFRLADSKQVHGTVALMDRRALEPDPGVVETLSRIESECGKLLDRRRLARAHDRLAAMLEASHDAVVGWSIDGEIISWNPAATRLYGYAADEILGRSILTLVPDEIHERWHRRAAEVARGVALEQFETVRRRKDGSWVDVSLTVSPIRDESGRVVAVATIARDISERKKAEAQRELLLEELNHRVKNTLAIVQGLAQQTFKSTKTSLEGQQAFEGRLAALAAAHDVLTRTNWENASLAQLIVDVLPGELAHRRRLRSDGPTVLLRPKQALAIAMTLHELYTNAVKYGALANESGSIGIEWRVSNGPGATLRLAWREVGGPRVERPSQRGFGTRLIAETLAGDLQGDVTLEFRPEGLVYVLEAPFSA